MSIIVGKPKFEIIDGGGNREWGQNLPKIWNHLTTISATESIKTYLDQSKSKTAQTLIDLVLYALKSQRSCLAVYNTPDGVEYFAADDYQKVLARSKEYTDSGITVQLRHIFRPVESFTQFFTPDDMANIKSDSDLLEKLRQVEIAKNGVCRFTVAEDVIDSQPIEPPPPPPITQKEKPRTFAIGDQIFRTIDGTPELDINEATSQQRGKLKLAFSHPSIMALRDRTSNPFMQQFFLDFLQCIKTDYDALAVVFHPKDRKITLKKYKSVDDLDADIDRQTTSTSPQIRAVVFTCHLLHKQINPEELGDINTTEDVLAYFRNVYESRDIDYYYTQEFDQLQPFELGPFSYDMNIIMNIFEKMQTQNIDLRYVWFFVGSDGDIALHASDKPIPFDTVRLSLTPTGQKNSVLLALDLERPFDEQLFDYDPTSLTFDDLLESPIDIVGGRGQITFDENTVMPHPKVAYLPPKFGKH